MPRRKKNDNNEVKKSVVEFAESEELQDGEDENDEKCNKCVVLVGENFKIIETRYSKDVYERCPSKTKDENGNEIDTFVWKNRGYFGEYINACKEIKKLISKNKRFDKKIIESIDELIKMTKESDEKTEKIFSGLEI
jgi:hypothetical protein